jgi:succinate dehydrogenase/fumarate reductase flavoprotein subunit
MTLGQARRLQESRPPDRPGLFATPEAKQVSSGAHTVTGKASMNAIRFGKIALLRATLLAVFGFAASGACAATACDTPDPCAARACRLDAQVAQARAAGKTKELAALERAQVENTHCSDDGLKVKRAAALTQAQQGIDKRSAELAKAQASGNPAKVKKAQKKLDNAQAVYKELQNSPL